MQITMRENLISISPNNPASVYNRITWMINILKSSRWTRSIPQHSSHSSPWPVAIHSMAFLVSAKRAVYLSVTNAWVLQSSSTILPHVAGALRILRGSLGHGLYKKATFPDDGSSLRTARSSSSAIVRNFKKSHPMLPVESIFSTVLL
jgi:hypothetical protein